jgi:pilus assembly protein Flp/PilA
MFSVLTTWVKANLNLKNDEGQTMAEYGVILALIAVVCLGVFGFLGDGISTKVGEVVSSLK